MKTSLWIVISLIIVSLSDAQNGDCVVKRIDNGNIQIARVGAAYFNWKYFRYVKDTTYENVPLEKRIPHGKRVYLTCRDGFAVQGKRGQGRVPVTCKEGRWDTDAICLITRCTEPPPKINHGRVENFSSNHRSTAKYVCDDPYDLSGGNKVECLLGEWKGVPPRCADNRCFFSELKNRSGISYKTEASTKSGSELDVICEDGFSVNRTAPLCLEGQWIESDSPCTENDCIVRRIRNGNIQISRVGAAYFNWKYFRYVKDTTYENVPLEIKIRHGIMVYLGCKDGFTFQGKSGEFRFPVYCKKGRWEPDAVCLRTGSVYTPTTTAPRMTHGNSPQEHEFVPERTTASTTSTTSRTTASTTSTTYMIKVIPTSTSPSTTTVDLEGLPAIPDSVSKDECYCIMTVNDENLVTYVGDKELKNGDRVQNGSIIKFRCKEFGFPRLTGPLELKCQNCRSWHSSEFPTCIQPTPASYCTLEMLLKMLPEAVAPSIDNIHFDQALPEGFDMKLQCERDLVLKGSPIATCTSGLWKLGGPTSATYCTPACRLNVDASSRLKVYREKELFLLGEFVYFWCPYKYRMTQRIEKAMCLSGFWSNPAPDCIPL